MSTMFPVTTKCGSIVSSKNSMKSFKNSCRRITSKLHLSEFFRTGHHLTECSPLPPPSSPLSPQRGSWGKNRLLPPFLDFYIDDWLRLNWRMDAKLQKPDTLTQMIFVPKLSEKTTYVVAFRFGGLVCWISPRWGSGGGEGWGSMGENGWYILLKFNVNVLFENNLTMFCCKLVIWPISASVCRSKFLTIEMIHWT